MNILQLILQALQFFVSFLVKFYEMLSNVLHGVSVKLFKEFLHLTWALTAAIPIPESLQGLSIPDPGPLGWAVVALGVPTALAIISAAFAVRMAKNLIPFIGR